MRNLVERFAGSLAKIHTKADPAGIVLTLPPAPGQRLYAWDVDGNVAMDVELRARIVSCPPGFLPLVRYSIELGHGRIVYTDPQPSVAGPLGGAVVFEQEILPARGMVWRLSAKQLRVNFQNFTAGLAPPAPDIKIAVSVQPVLGAARPYRMRQQFVDVPAAGSSGVSRFPADFDSWHVRSAVSGKVLAGGYTVDYISLTNATIATVAPPTLRFEDPIPVLAAGWRLNDTGGGAALAMAQYDRDA